MLLQGVFFRSTATIGVFCCEPVGIFYIVILFFLHFKMLQCVFACFNPLGFFFFAMMLQQ